MSIPTDGYTPQTCFYNVQGWKTNAQIGMDVTFDLVLDATNTDDWFRYAEAAVYAIANAATADGYTVNIVQRTFRDATRNEALPWPPA